MVAQGSITNAVLLLLNIKGVPHSLHESDGGKVHTDPAGRKVH
jgi:hypothetical protein